MDIQKMKQSIKIQDKQDMKDVSILYLIDRLEKAEAQLAELAKQENNDSLAIKESQFLSDVMTAAGLVAHGKRDKALAERLSAYCVYRRNTTATPAPVKLPDALTAEDVRWMLKQSDHNDGPKCRIEHAECIGAKMWNACRAEVLRLNAIDNTAQQYESLGKGDKC